MPYTMTKSVSQCSVSKPYAVVNRNTGKVVPGGCHATKAEALKHLAALKINVSDA